MKKRRMFKAMLFAIVGVMLMSQMGIIGFAAADPVPNTVITQNPEFSTSSGRIIGFDTVDSADGSHGNVAQYRYNTSGTMSVVEYYPTEEKQAVTDKMVSFDFYIYDNSISYEVRLVQGEKATPNMAQFNINVDGVGIAPDATREKAKIGIGSNTYTETDATVSNKEWHRMDAILAADGTKFYVDGSYVGKYAAPLESSYFTGFQIVNRAGANVANAVTDQSGLYLANLKTMVYNTNTQFYGTAAAVKGGVQVSFSETLQSGANFSDVVLYQTQTGAKVEIGTPVLTGTELFIPVTGQLDSGVEYMASFPTKPRGISGKPLYSDVYFTTDASNLGYTFEDYGRLTSNNTNVLVADTHWFTGNAVNIEDVSQDTSDPEDAEHKNVLYAAGWDQGATLMRWGVQAPMPIDVTRGEASVEFDFKLKDVYYNYLVVQMYSTGTDGAADEALVNAGSLVNRQFNQPKVQFMSFSVMGKTKNTDFADSYNKGNPYIHFRKDNSNIYIDQPVSNSSMDWATVTKDEWHTIKMTVNKPAGAEYPAVKLYLDGTIVGENIANISGDAISDYLKGVRFIMDTYQEESGKSTDKIYIDNVRFSGAGISEATVQKIRIYDPEGEEYGPLASDVPITAGRAAIYLSDTIDSLDNVIVSMDNGIDTQATLSEDGKVINVTFKKMLIPDTEHTITVSGVGNTFTASFTTTNREEFLIYDLRVTDAAGSELTTGSISAGTAYVYATVVNATTSSQTALILGTVCNGLQMNAVNFEEVTLEAGGKQEVSFAIAVADITDLNIKAMAWDSFERNKPLVDAVEY